MTTVSRGLHYKMSHCTIMHVQLLLYIIIIVYGTMQSVDALTAMVVVYPALFCTHTHPIGAEVVIKEIYK